MSFFTNYLCSQGVPEDHILAIRLGQRSCAALRNPIALCEYVEALVATRKNERFFLFIDDVELTTTVVDHACGGLTVSLHDMLNELKGYKNLDVYVATSQARGLARAIPTEFRGRSTRIPVFPLSFAEFHAFVGGDEHRALQQYMLYGGMPGVLALEEEQEKKEYLAALWQDLWKESVDRGNAGRKILREDFLDVLASTVGSPTTPAGIARALSSLRQARIPSAQVADCLQLAQDAFLIARARRYDVKLKKYFRHPDKYYFADPGLCNARLHFCRQDPARAMENILYLELVRRGYCVDVGVVTDRTAGAHAQREIAFVVNDADRRCYIQCAVRMDTQTRNASVPAELAPLMLVKDSFRKVVVRMDIPRNFFDEHGIYHCNLIDVLLGRVEIF